MPAAVCRECGAGEERLRDVDGCATCTSCGLVAEEFVLDEGPEWRNHAEDTGTDRNRCGPPPSLSSLHTRSPELAELAIGVTRDDGSGVLLQRTQRRVSRASVPSGRRETVFGRETDALRATMQGDANMRRLAVQDDAVETYRRFRMSEEGRKLQEPARRGLMAACAMYATQNSDAPSPSSSVMRRFGVGPHELNLARNRMTTHPTTEKWVKSAQANAASHVVSYTAFVVNTMMTHAEASRTDRAVIRKKAKEVEDGVRGEISAGCDPIRVAVAASRAACEELKGRAAAEEWFGDVSVAMILDVSSMHTIHKWDALIRRSRARRHDGA